MHAQEIVDYYLKAITNHPDAWRRWATHQTWTPFATGALVDLGLTAFPGADAAAKGRRDRYGRAEYLALDACIWQDEWGAPLFIAEHENYPVRDRVQYSAWKLLCVEAQRRVLVAYFGDEGDLVSFEDLLESVRTVCKEQGGKDILLISAEYKDVGSNDELRALHKSAVVGYPTRR